MSQPIKEFTVDAKELMLDDAGQPCLWFTNALWYDNDYPEQATMQQWAETAAVSSQNAEVAVRVNLDLPAAVRDLLENAMGELNVLNGYTVDPKYKEQLHAFRRQLHDAIAMFNRVTYSETPVTTEIVDRECHPTVYEYGQHKGLFDMTKERAAEYCRQQTEKTGQLHDYHFVGGRAQIKALPESWKEPL